MSVFDIGAGREGREEPRELTIAAAAAAYRQGTQLREGKVSNRRDKLSDPVDKCFMSLLRAWFTRFCEMWVSLRLLRYSRVQT